MLFSKNILGGVAQWHIRDNHRLWLTSLKDALGVAAKKKVLESENIH